MALIPSRDKKIVVVGLGYVGLPLACKFAEVGFTVIGLDVDGRKVKLVNQGQSPIEGEEPGLFSLIEKVVNAGNLRATTNPEAIREAQFIIIAVQTPFDTQSKEPLYRALVNATETVGEYMNEGVLVVVESTVAPTTLKNIVKPILEEKSGLTAGKGFNLASCPERVMPGKLLHNLVNLDRVVGGYTPECGERARQLYGTVVRGRIDVVDSTTAELVKTVENAYRDVQIAFANEIALLCEHVGVDVYKVRELVNRVPERNMHLPGTGVGGHCIPKDSWLLIYGTRGNYQPRILTTARDINEYMPHHVAELTLEGFRRAGKSIAGSKIVVLGLAYLPNSDDTRNSPTIPLVNDLVLRNARVHVHDPYVTDQEALVSEVVLTQNLEEAMVGADALVVSTRHSVYEELTLEDLERLMNHPLIIIDGRNLFSDLKPSEKLIYLGVGRVFFNSV